MNQSNPDMFDMWNQVSLQPLQAANMLATYSPAKERLFLFDYDGTLAEIVYTPSDAIISQSLLEKLRTLASEPKNTVWIISGRNRTFLQTQLGVLQDVGLVAEHGAFMRRPNSSEWENLATRADLSWMVYVKKSFQAFLWELPMMNIRFEEKKMALVLDYQLEYHQADAVIRVAEYKRHVERQFQGFPVQFIQGKYNLEARPANVNKAHAVMDISDAVLSTGGSPDFIFCAGDDTTDEDMFHALRGSKVLSVFTVKIGGEGRASNAQYFLDNPAALWSHIELLNKCDEGGDAKGMSAPQSDGSHKGSRLYSASRSDLLSS